MREISRRNRGSTRQRSTPAFWQGGKKIWIRVIFICSYSQPHLVSRRLSDLNNVQSFASTFMKSKSQQSLANRWSNAENKTPNRVQNEFSRESLSPDLPTKCATLSFFRSETKRCTQKGEVWPRAQPSGHTCKESLAGSPPRRPHTEHTHGPVGKTTVLQAGQRLIH